MYNSYRRKFILAMASTAMVSVFSATAKAEDPVIIGVPAAQSGPVGVADHQDWTNGATMAIEDINAAGGVLGRPLEMKIIDLDMLTPEGNVAGMQALIVNCLNRHV